jgi:hemerythrin-like domain-containing protein
VKLSTLQQEFLDDHRKLTRDLKSLLASLERGDLGEAIAVATELDRDAGAHMAFEEEVFYPRLARVHGQPFVDRMVDEHETGQRAVKRVLDLQSGAELTESQHDELVADLRVALGHVLSCGTMLSELDSGESTADRRALDRLRQLRAEGELWSDRSYSD